MSPRLFTAFMLAGAVSAAIAAPLKLLADERSVASYGATSTYTDRIYFDGTPPESSVVADNKTRRPIVYRPVTRTRSFNVSDGMSLRTPLATLDGQGAQTSSFSTTAIRFSGVADVFATASSTSEQGENFSEIATGVAGGSAESQARWRFALDGVQPMLFSMTSNQTIDHLSGFSFSLTADNGFSWTVPYLSTDEGALFTFTTGLKLRPGTYTLDARLRAGVNDVQDGSRGDRATAAFSLVAVSGARAAALVPQPATPVPEPTTASLAVTGLLLLWGARRLGLRLCRQP